MELNIKKKKRFNIKKILVIFSVLVFTFCGVKIIPKFEGEKPDISVNVYSENFIVGVDRNISFSVSDKKTGIKSLKAFLEKDGKLIPLLDEHFKGSYFFSDKNIHEKKFDIIIEPKKFNITDGYAKLKIIATDFSLRKNINTFKKDIKIDTLPPDINILTQMRNIEQGGTGFIIYRLSEPCKISGVKIGNDFFPGYSGNFTDKNIFISFFGIRHDEAPNTEILLQAVDYAENNSYIFCNKYLREKKFKESVININQSLLNFTAVRFNKEFDEESKNASPLDKFLYVNGKIRKENDEVIANICKNTENKILWNGAFLRLPKSANMASFADTRNYRYSGKNIDKQTHLGIDLASVAKAEIPAANSGKVVFTGSLGIYGNTVIIDHGLGLFSLYGHMSRIYTKKEDSVSKGEIIGRTGSTGFALGDHLHFSIIINGIFVNPLEWWDISWIKNNISTKIEKIK